MDDTKVYFTKDVNEAMAAMSEEEMYTQLLALESTPMWFAILKYNQARLHQSQAALFTGDPVADPSSMRLNQGVMLGLCDLQNAVILLKQQMQEVEKEAARGGGEETRK